MYAKSKQRREDGGYIMDYSKYSVGQIIRILKAMYQLREAHRNMIITLYDIGKESGEI